MDLEGLKPDTVFSILPRIKKNNRGKKSLKNVLSHSLQVNKSSIKNTKKERKRKGVQQTYSGILYSADQEDHSTKCLQLL